jgi:hypothetical protein
MENNNSKLNALHAHLTAGEEQASVGKFAENSSLTELIAELDSDDLGVGSSAHAD